MNFKPLRDYSEHDVLNFFKLDVATGSKATPVVIANSGWTHNNGTPKVAYNIAAGQNNGNIYSPRWDIYPAVRKAVAGEKPLGLLLYDVQEVNEYNYPLIWDKQRREERQTAVSGQAVPIVGKGVFTVGPFASGETPAPGKFLVVKGTGDLGVATSGNGNGAFGEFLGIKDAQGYALVRINCYL